MAVAVDIVSGMRCRMCDDPCPLHGERHGACDVGCVHCARRVSPDQSPTPACKCSPRRPHRRRWSTRMCLAELGEGVARGARPIRVIDATSSLQESLSLRVGHRASRIRIDTRLGSQNTNEKRSSRRGREPGERTTGVTLWPRCADTVRYATACSSQYNAVYRRSHANSRHSTAVYSCTSRRARLICTVAEPTKWCSPRCPRAPPTARCARPAVPLRPAPAPVQLAPALTLLLQWATHCPRASTPSA